MSILHDMIIGNINEIEQTIQELELNRNNLLREAMFIQNQIDEENNSLDILKNEFQPIQEKYLRNSDQSDNIKVAKPPKTRPGFEY